MTNFFQREDRAVSRKSAGHDFLAFYTAGTFVRTGHAAQLYDLDAVRTFEREMVKREGLELPESAFGPFWNPPLFAWVFAPLAKLPYHTAWLIWTGFNVLCFAGAMTILARILKREDAAPAEPDLRVGAIGDERSALLGGAQQPVDWKTWALVPLLTTASMPFIQAIGHGQNTCLSLLILCATIALWRNQRGILAGACCGLLFYKPQLAAIFAIALVFSLGWRAIVGLILTGSGMLGATEWTLPGSLLDFIHRLPGNVAYMQVEHRYLWERHVTLKAFWRLVLQGYAVGDLLPLTKWLYIGSIAIVGACLFAAVLKLRRQTDQISRDRLIAVTIVTMPLLMPFYFDYDLLLLSAAAVLVAREHLSTGKRIAWPMLASWALLYAWTIFNPAVATATRVNGTVVLMSMLSAVLIRQAIRRERSAAMALEPMTSAATLRHAA